MEKKMGGDGALFNTGRCGHRGLGQSGKVGVSCDEKSDRRKISGRIYPGNPGTRRNVRMKTYPSLLQIS